MVTARTPGRRWPPDLSTPPLDDNRLHIGELVERIGFGRAQLRAGFTGGGVWLADGAELLLISSVAKTVGTEWGMTPLERGMIVSIVFCGMYVGNLVSGPLGDKHGRRNLILASYLGIFVFSVGSALSTSVAVLAGVRLLVGISIGLGQPAWISLATEVTPTRWRAAMNGVSQSFFAVGETYTALLLLNDDPSLSQVHWRWLLFLGALPSAVFFLASLALLNESPSFLAVRGHRHEATAVLESMRDSNSVGDFSVDFQEVQQAPHKQDEPAKPWFHEWSLVFSQEFAVTTLITMFSCFTENFCFFGTVYAFPQILRELDMGGTPALHLVLGALAEIPGYALAVWLGSVLPRKVNLKLFLTLIVGALFSFMIGIQHLQSSVGVFVASSGFYCLKVLFPALAVVCFLYAAEVFPAEIRTTGASVCLASGRVAAMIAPLAYEALTSSSPKGGAEAFLMILLGLVMTNAGLINLLPFETFGKSLQIRIDTPRAQNMEQEKVPKTD